jgi:hypothetical protein
MPPHPLVNPQTHQDCLWQILILLRFGPVKVVLDAVGYEGQPHQTDERITRSRLCSVGFLRDGIL